MASPSTVFCHVPELLRILVEQIRSRKQLARLRLASKVFHDVVTPFLFYEINVGSKGIHCLCAVADSGHLKYVRKFSVESDYAGNDDDYQEVVQQMLPKMPLLESFKWVDLPLASATLSILHQSCPFIKSICLAFPEDMGERVLGYMSEREYDQPKPSQLRARGVYGSPDLTAFANLEELALDNLCEELPWWGAQLIQVLENNPGLRKLRLSLSVNTIRRYAWYNEGFKFNTFFNQLCEDYGDTSAAPLHLQVLDLGTAVFPFRRTTLEMLTDLSYLQEAHIRNKIVHQLSDIMLLYGYYEEESGITFDAFGSGYCPNLRRFTAADYRGDVHELFATIEEPLFARQLAVSCEQMGAGYELAALLRPDSERYPHLPLHLRMIDIDLEREQIFLIESKGEIHPIEQVLADLVSGDNGALEGLTVHLPEDPNAKGGFKHLDLLILALTKLVNLTQLSIISNYPHHTELVSKTLEEAAYMVAAAARSLLYIRVYQNYWRIWRDIDSAIRLEELEDREITDVELFSHSIWEPKAQ